MTGGIPVRCLAALLSGAIFGIGVAVSGLVNPDKVKAFFDIASIGSGRWDPSLIIVLISAMLVMMAAIRLGHRRRQPLAETAFLPMTETRVDRSLVAGSALFGIGCGMSGLGPETALADLIWLVPDVWIFVLAMALGAFGVHLVRRKSVGNREANP